jgi:hypothetical protein
VRRLTNKSGGNDADATTAQEHVEKLDGLLAKLTVYRELASEQHKEKMMEAKEVQGAGGGEGLIGTSGFAQ